MAGVAGASVALAVLDHVGSPGRAALDARAVAIITYPVIWSGWLSGVVLGLVKDRRP
jgi:hypothetical protein